MICIIWDSNVSLGQMRFSREWMRDGVRRTAMWIFCSKGNIFFSDSFTSFALCLEPWCMFYVVYISSARYSRDFLRIFGVKPIKQFGCLPSKQSKFHFYVLRNKFHCVPMKLLWPQTKKVSPNDFVLIVEMRWFSLFFLIFKSGIRKHVQWVPIHVSYCPSGQTIICHFRWWRFVRIPHFPIMLNVRHGQ